MIEQLIAEATECDFKVALETKKPKSWLKSVSAFSNGIGGTLFFGISDDRKPIGLSDVQKDAEAISRLIKERITPLPQFILKPLQEDGKNLLALEVSPGRSTPYYYKADGVMEAYIRVGNESVIAPDYIVNELILKGTNQSFDTLTTEAVKKDYSFTLLEATYLERTGLRFEPSDYVSFGLADKNGFLTNAGKLMTDQHTVYNSRMFCTRWNGLEKGSIFDDALDDKEYEGNVEFHNCTLDVDNDIVSRPLFENNIDIIISLNSMVSIINKVRSHRGFVSFMTITKGRNAFNVVGNKKTLQEISTNKNFQGAVSLFCAYEEIRYINRDYITKNIDLIDKWKVFISKANGGAGTLSPNNSVAILGKPYIGIPNSICTDSLIPIGGYDNKFEAQNLQKYMQTKFLRFIVGILKVSQNLYQNVYQLVPLQDFTKDSDINWTESISKIDKQLYLKYGLSEEEINYIESMIKPME